MKSLTQLFASILPAKLRNEVANKFEDDAPDLFAETIKNIVHDITKSISLNAKYGKKSVEISQHLRKHTDAYTSKVTDYEVTSVIVGKIHDLIMPELEALGYKIVESKGRWSMGECDTIITWDEEEFIRVIERIGRGSGAYFVYVTDRYHKVHFKKDEKKEEAVDEAV
jgi:hypothetical protein